MPDEEQLSFFSLKESDLENGKGRDCCSASDSGLCYTDFILNHIDRDAIPDASLLNGDIHVSVESILRVDEDILNERAIQYRRQQEDNEEMVEYDLENFE